MDKHYKTVLLVQFNPNCKTYFVRLLCLRLYYICHIYDGSKCVSFVLLVVIFINFTFNLACKCVALAWVCHVACSCIDYSLAYNRLHGGSTVCLALIDWRARDVVHLCTLFQLFLCTRISERHSNTVLAQVLCY